MLDYILDLHVLFRYSIIDHYSNQEANTKAFYGFLSCYIFVRGLMYSPVLEMIFLSLIHLSVCLLGCPSERRIGILMQFCLKSRAGIDGNALYQDRTPRI